MKNNKPENNTEMNSSVTTTDDIPQGVKNLYLSTTGGATDNLGSMPNFNVVSGEINSHLANTNNPHADILSGLRTHQTQITLSQSITLNNSQYIDCLLVQASNTTDYVITIPNETTIGQQFATNAAFVAFRMGTSNLTVQLASGVSFTNMSGSSIVLPNPQTSYYLFIRQSLNKWAVVTYASSSGASTTLQQAYNNGSGTITLATGNPFSLNGPAPQSLILISIMGLLSQ